MIDAFSAGMLAALVGTVATRLMVGWAGSKNVKRRGCKQTIEPGLALD